MSSGRRELLEELEGRFGERCRARGERAGPLATVFPADAGEVGLLAQMARRRSLRLYPVGAGLDPDLPEPVEDAVLVGTEMMRAVRFPDERRSLVEVEPGVLWLELEGRLRAAHRALTVYPTSAPRTTVGGWIARDGVGVGSFAYGWLRENVLSAEIVLPDGRPRTLLGDDLDLAVGAMGKTGVIVRATLRLRETSGDRPFAAAFGRSEALQGAIDALLERRPPLWHLGFMNPPVALAMGSVERYLLFGACPASVAAPEGGLARALGENHGRTLDAAEAHRLWGNRVFPVDPAHPTPAPGRVLIPASMVGRVLDLLESGPARPAVLGSIARDGSALLLVFAGSGGRLRSLSAGDEAALVGAARSVGGDNYHAVLVRRGRFSKDAGSRR